MCGHLLPMYRYDQTFKGKRCTYAEFGQVCQHSWAFANTTQNNYFFLLFCPMSVFDRLPPPNPISVSHSRLLRFKCKNSTGQRRSLHISFRRFQRQRVLLGHCFRICGRSTFVCTDWLLKPTFLNNIDYHNTGF